MLIALRIYEFKFFEMIEHVTLNLRSVSDCMKRNENCSDYATMQHFRNTTLTAPHFVIVLQPVAS